MIRGAIRLIDRYFFDTDCLSAFLWVRKESVLTRLYAGRIILPMQVYTELEKVPHLKRRVDILKESGDLRVEDILVETEEFSDYLQMTTLPESGMRIIGKGEAAGIAMAKHRKGILASNNLRDIRPYVEKYSIRHITAGDILKEALHTGLITEEEGNALWEGMLRKRRMLPAATFSEFLKNERRDESDRKKRGKESGKK